MTHPRWEDLSPADQARFRDRKTYDLEDWRVMSTWENDKGQTVLGWGMTYEGISRASQARRERIVASRTRREADDSWSAEVERMVDRTP